MTETAERLHSQISISAHGVKKLSIPVGGEVELSIDTQNQTGKLKWYSDNDEVLNVKASIDGKHAMIKALVAGESQILVSTKGRRPRVVGSILIAVRSTGTGEFEITFGRVVRK